jgi:hypothetical protein
VLTMRLKATGSAKRKRSGAQSSVDVIYRSN